MAIDIRAIAHDELDAMLVADSRAFGGPLHPPDESRTWAESELDRTRVAFEGDEIVGVSRAYSFELTMPGGALVPAAAVSWVAVMPTHRRRGILTSMIGALHADARERGEPAAILTASEHPIYGRFGYGIATWRLGLTSERARITFRDDRDYGRTRMLSREEAEKVLPQVYERTRRVRAGMVSRPDYWWPTVFWDQLGGKDKAFFVVVHSDPNGVDDGFVAYEMTGHWTGGLPDRRLLVWDMHAATPEAYAALWRYAYSVDLVGTVAATNVPIDDPLRHLVVDGRRVRVDFVNDGLWLAPLDPVPLLAARTYSIPGRLNLEVHAPDGSVTTYAVEGDPTGGQCTITTASTDLVCSTATLGACVLGGNRWSELAQAGLVEAHSEEALRRADAMFMTNPAPALITSF